MRITLALLGLIALAPAPDAAAQDRPSVAPKSMHAVAPALAQYTDKVLFGDIWERPDLKPRDRSIVTLAILISTGKTAQMSGHLARALTNGVTPREIAEIATHLAFYSGWPNAVSAINVIEKSFKDHDIALPFESDPAKPEPAPDQQRAANGQMAKLAPKFEQLTAEVIFASLWRRTDIGPRDRSLVTIAALAANGDEIQLASHIERGLANGLTHAEIIEEITHLAFYAGWAKANSAMRVAATVMDKQAPRKPFVIFPGDQPSTAETPSHFTGTAAAQPRFQGLDGSRMTGATVSFQPGARTNWHSHPLGQLLIVTAGHGWFQTEGQPIRAINAGDVIWTAPGVQHWHGATRTSAMTHVGITEPLDGTTATWAKPVGDGDYHGPD